MIKTIYTFAQWMLTQLSRIRTKLFLTYFFLIVITVTIIGFSSAYYSQLSINSKIEQANMLIVTQIQKNLDSKFSQIRNLLVSPYYRTDFVSGINQYDLMTTSEQFLFKQNLSDYFLKSLFISPQDDYVGFHIFYHTGELLYTTPGIDKNGLERSYSTSEWVKKTIEKNGNVYFSGPYQDQFRNNERNLYSASIMVRDYPDHQNIFSIVRYEYSFDNIENISKDANISENSELLIVDEQNQIVFSTMENLEVGDLYHTELMSYVNGLKGMFWFKNEEGTSLITYSKLEEPNWKMLLITPKGDLVEASSNIRNTTIILALIAFFVTAIISLFFSKSITAPIINLYRSLNRTKQNYLHERPETNPNEIKYITENVNQMVVEIESLLKAKYIYEIKLRESELAMLYSQINPHFLYNTLDSIRAMSDYYKVEDISLMTQSLADMLRYSTKHNADYVKIEEEIRHVKDYLTIQKIRFQHKIAVDVEIDEDVLKEDMLKMTLQPLIENSMHHGLERKKGKGELTLKTYGDSHFIYFDIIDDGLGIEEEKLKQMKKELVEIRNKLDVKNHKVLGIGLSNVYSRYLIQYGMDFDMDIQSQLGKGTHIQMKFPKRQKSK
ncbi:cache domain-containing sensor histidine kinase [Bacillus solitudinis]|uniref:cache domain-containing sensor histidine kinase n=1 Tax=Bacillus solitudinis TaxID=2014074 RepID=UPI000C2406C9|nr:histidine kinase [Bacillus solitudinis]